jgi:hypothetical protein
MRNRALIGAIAGTGLFWSAIAGASDFSFTKLADTTTPVPGGTFGNFTDVRLVAADGPNVAFTGTYRVDNQNHTGLYQYHNGAISTIADLSISAPTGGAFQQIVAGNEYIGGNLVFGGTTDAGLGIYRYNGSGISTVVAPGTVLPVDGGTLASLAGKGLSGDANTAAFSGANSNGKQVLYSVIGNQIHFLADDETHVPGIELGTYHDFPEVHARNGQTLFVGTALDPDSTETVFEPAGVFRAGSDDVLQSLATRSTIIEDAPEFYFKEFENPRIGNDGRAYFTGGFLDKEEKRSGRGGEPDHFMGVFAITGPGEMETLADSEMELPGLVGEIEEYNRYSFDGGAKVFGVSADTGVTYLYLQEPDGDFVHVLDTTQMLDGKQLSTLRMTLDPAENGIVSFRAVFADGSSGVYSFAVPEPGTATLLFAATLAALRRRR